MTTATPRPKYWPPSDYGIAELIVAGLFFIGGAIIALTFAVAYFGSALLNLLNM